MLVKSPEKEKALLFGINTYPGAPLHGCVNDIEDTANLLVSRYGWDPANVRLLSNERCTRKEMLNRLNWLVDVKAGARVFLHQSGHGVQWPSRSYSGEPDGLLEAFCPYDFAWDDNGMITDKKYVGIFSRIPKGVEFTWVSDSCHSGDLSRALNNPHDSVDRPVMIPRAYPVPADIRWRYQGVKSRSIEVTTRSMSCGKLDVGFVSGCKSNQTSADTVVDGRPCGALTWYLIQALKAAPDASLRAIVLNVNAALKRLHYTQSPQAEGNRANKPFMSGYTGLKPKEYELLDACPACGHALADSEPGLDAEEKDV
jgi:hypothetical protein